MASFLRTKRLVWGVIFAIVTLVALVSYFTGKRYLAAVRAVEHTLTVKSAINDTLSLLKDAETGQRGFILSGDEQFLEPYQDAERQVPSLFKKLGAVTAGDAEQAVHLKLTAKLIEQKFEFIEGTIRARRAGNFDLALVLVRGRRGKILMDDIRRQCRLMLDHEDGLLALRKGEAEGAQRVATWGIGIGSLLTIILALVSLLTVNRDVAELKQAAEELAASEEYYRLLTEQSSDLVRLLRLDGITTYVSPSVERLLGYGVEEFLALAPRALMHPDELATGAQMLAAVQSGILNGGESTYRLRNKSGEYRWFEARWAVRKDSSGNPHELHIVARDVTERRDADEQLSRHAEQLRSLSLRDELTGLYNRRGFSEVAAQAHGLSLHDARPAGLVFVDLNGMKRINDEQGHDVGDQALVDAADVLSSVFGETDVVARLGGDEFVAFALDFAEGDLASLRVRIRELADKLTGEQERTYRLSMSVGGAFLSAGSQASLQELLDQADVAMYEQKNARRAAGGVSILPTPSQRL